MTRPQRLLVLAASTLVAATVLAPAPAAARHGPGGESVDEVYRASHGGAGGVPVFRDGTSALDLERPLRGMRVHAVAVGDVNDDGWSDLFVGSFADRPESDYRVRGADGPSPDRLLLGGPTGFRADDSFPAEHGRTSAATFGDLDGDGDVDLVLGRNVRDVDRGRAPSRILRNDGGRFVPVAEFDRPRGVRAIGLIDANRDSRLDLVVVEDRFAEGSSVLLLNRGQLRFVDATRAAGLPNGVTGMSVSTADLNGDEAADILISGSNRLFLGRNDGTFSESASVREVLDWPRYGDEDDPAGVVASDINGDGLIDLVIGQHYNSTIEFQRRVPVRLYLNQGNDPSGAPRFRDVTDSAGLVPLPTKAPHVDVVDLDSDGRLDILTTASAGEAPVAFRQTGVENGIPQFEPTGSPEPAKYWVTAAVLDADHDGRVDVLLGEFEPTAPSLLLRNRTDTGHWFGVTAEPGMRVEIYRSGEPTEQRRLIGRREMGVSTGFASGPAPTAWFGLGPVKNIDVRISNRNGEVVTELHDVAADRLVRTSS